MSSPGHELSSRARPPDQKRSPSARASISRRVSSTGIPRPTSSRAMANRNANVLPTYDFLSGAPSSPPGQPLRQSFRQSKIARPDNGNEDLRAELNTVKYELESLKQERELSELRHEKELRQAQQKAEADFKRAQASESSSHVTAAKYDALAKELNEVQDRFANEKNDLERKLRASKDQNRTLQEEVEEIQAELASQERQNKHRLAETDSRFAALQKTSEELRDDLDSKVTALHVTQERLSQRETEVGQLESEILRLKAQSGDADTLNVIKRELSEQVAHIKRLEAVNRDQLAELKHFRKINKSVEVVEEEKRELENKLRLMDDLRKELNEVSLQRQILDDERRSWTSFLQTQAGETGDLEFDSPEAMARALIKERVETASLLNRNGAVETEFMEKESVINQLEKDKTKLQAELEKSKTSGAENSSDSRLRTRLERQRTLAVKEVEYLRAQLRTFDAEETTFQPEHHLDEQKTKQIQQLEELVDQYRKELQGLNEELGKLEKRAPEEAQTGTKRAREDDADERLGQLARKNRKLQEEVTKLQQSSALLQKELDAHKSQLTSLKSSSRTRVLELRSNPTADAEAIKLSTLSSLREENKALLNQLTGAPNNAKVVPISTLENLRNDIRDMEKMVAEKEKRMTRLKEIWSAKSLEFREAVASILGWKMDFMPNGRVRVTSMFHTGNDQSDGENSIIFDGENGTMKISGGPNSLFALEIKNLIKFWVEGRKEIPCFLAAMTLEFYEKTTRAARM